MTMRFGSDSGPRDRESNKEAVIGRLRIGADRHRADLGTETSQLRKECTIDLIPKSYFGSIE